MREDFWAGQAHGYHYAAKGKDAGYALLIVHGIGGHGGTYDVFCEPLSERGVDIVSMDLPGHGLARNDRGNFRFTEWLEDMDIMATAMRERFGKPVFVLGSSQGSAAAFHSLAVSDAISGAITMCIILSEVEPDQSDPLHRHFAAFQSFAARATAQWEGDARRFDLVKALDWNKNYSENEANILEKKQQDPLRAWSYGHAGLVSYYNHIPPRPSSANDKPVLVTVGERDPLVSCAYVRKCFDHIGGPKQLEIVANGTHQLMLYHADVYLPLVDGWCRRSADALA